MWVKGIFKASFSLCLDQPVVTVAGEILDIVAVVLWVSEGSIKGLDIEVFQSFVCEANQSIDGFTSYEFFRKENKIIRIL